MKIKFCMECGGPLKMRYPGNDPECGPARMDCKEHGSPVEFFDMEHRSKSYKTQIENIISDLQENMFFGNDHQEDFSKEMKTILETQVLPLAGSLDDSIHAFIEEESKQYEEYLKEHGNEIWPEFPEMPDNYTYRS